MAMSEGITPYDFVQQVFYVQEKVLLDFHPDDDVYKEVLTEANLAISELERAEDWHWLRSTSTLGIPRQDLKGHGFRHQHDVWLDIPSNVRKLSALYGDCIRLCRYRVVGELVGYLHACVHTWMSKIRKAQKGLDTLTDQFCGDNVHVYYTGANTSRVDVSHLVYGGTFATRISDSTSEHLKTIIKANHWYLDADGHAYFGAESAAKYYSAVTDPDIPLAIHVCNPLADDELEEPPHGKLQDLTSDAVKPVPSGPSAASPWWHHAACWHPFLADPLMIVFDPNDLEFSPLVEIFENDFIRVPITATGRQYHAPRQQTDLMLQNDRRDPELGACIVGNRITFTRPLLPWEANRVALADTQSFIERFHVCTHACTTSSGTTPSYPDSMCSAVADQTTRKMLTEVPDPTYLIWRTAERHCAGSPVSAARVMDLQSAAQKILSAMRQDNADATTPDYMEWWSIRHLNVV